MIRRNTAVLLLAAGALALGPAAMAHEPSAPPAAPTPPSGTTAAQAALDTLIVDYEAWKTAEDPLSAGANGDAEALSKLPDVTLAADARRRTALTAFQVRLTAIDPQGLDEDGKLNHAFLGRVIDGQLQAIAFDTGRLAFSSDDSWDGYIAYLAQVAPMTGKADAEARLVRQQYRERPARGEDEVHPASAYRRDRAGPGAQGRRRADRGRPDPRGAGPAACNRLRRRQGGAEGPGDSDGP
jgi:hypothetical protein